MKKLLLFATVALSAAAASQAPGPIRGDAKICKSIAEIGSRLKRTRTCLTQTEWDARSRDARDQIYDGQTRQMNRRVDTCVHMPCM
jgi:hypothetical protein